MQELLSKACSKLCKEPIETQSLVSSFHIYHVLSSSQMLPSLFIISHHVLICGEEKSATESLQELVFYPDNIEL